MAVLGESHSEGEPGVDIVHLNTRVSLGVVGWNLENGQLALVEGQLLDGLCVNLDYRSNPNQLISSSVHMNRSVVVFFPSRWATTPMEPSQVLS